MSFGVEWLETVETVTQPQRRFKPVESVGISWLRSSFHFSVQTTISKYLAIILVILDETVCKVDSLVWNGLV